MPSRARRLSQFIYDFARSEDLEEFRSRVTDGVRSVVDCDLASYIEVDLDNRRTYVITDRPVGEGIVAAFGQLAHQHPYHALELYQDVYRSLDAEDQIAITLQTAPHVIGLALNRCSRSFNRGDRNTLDMLRPLLADGYHRALARERGRALLRELAERNGRDRAVIALDGHGRLAYASDRAQAWLGTECPPQVLTDWVDAQPSASAARIGIRLDGVPLEVTLLPRTVPSDPILLELRRLAEDPSERRLTDRERQILELAATGASDKQIGNRLKISPRTVSNHLHAAYRKLGVENRTAATAALKNMH